MQTSRTTAGRQPLTLTQANSSTSDPTTTTDPTTHNTTPPPTDLPKARRVCIMVEPTPFTYVCGYMNRFRNTIRFLIESGCEVLVVTTGRGFCMPGSDPSAFVQQPADFHGAKVVEAFSFSLPVYGAVPLSFALSPRIWSHIKEFKPDVIHCTSPGVMNLAALIYSRLLKTSLVFSYHTHVPEYLPKYNLSWLVGFMWGVLRFFHGAAHLTLATSNILAEELKVAEVAPADAISVWKKGVCSDTFHPQFRCSDMKNRLTGGNPDQPLLLSVGRLGSEKNLKFLKEVVQRVPNARLAFVGDGPARAELEAHFAGTNTIFTGMLRGQELAAAYASADVFVMPSESETLGFVVLEAMASGIPVVAVRAGGIPDIISKNGETGFLYESGDLDAAVKLVTALVQNPVLRETIGVAARQEVSHWDWKAATNYLVHTQYPMAMAAAAVYYGKKLQKLNENVGYPNGAALVAS